MSATVIDNYQAARNALYCISPDIERGEWISICFALVSEFGKDEGGDLFHEWSKGGSTYDANAVKSVIRSADPNGGIKIGTLFHIAKRYGYQPEAPMSERVIDPEVEKRRAEAAKREAEELLLILRDTTLKSRAIWNAATQASPNHPYLVRKQVTPSPTLKEISLKAVCELIDYLPNAKGIPLSGETVLVAPIVQIRDGERVISNVELIDQTGLKAALAGRGTKAAGFWAACKMPEGDGEGVTILIAEGVATALSAHQSTEHPTVASLSASNMTAVAKLMRELYPKAALVVLADIGNGQADAEKAAQVVDCQIAVPVLPEGAAGKDFNDMMVAYKEDGMHKVKALIDGASDAADAWPDPNPLAINIAPADYPLDALPSRIREAVVEFAQHVKAPIPLVASSALATVSLVTQAHINARRDETLESPVSLYLLTIADSGERKSTCDKHFSRIITEHDREQAEVFKPKQEAYRADLEAWESERSGIKARIQEATKKGQDTTPHKNDLRALERDKPQPPKVPRLIYSDATPEALAQSLGTRWPAGGVMSSEAGQVLGAHAMSSDAIMRNLAQLNVLWDGGDLHIDRKSSESFIVRDVRLTIGLMTQEPTLREFYGKSGKLTRGTGFLARFLVAWPASTQGTRLYTEPPTGWPARDRFNQRLSDILRQPIPVNEEGRLVPAMACLSRQAKEFWTTFYNEIERELGLGGELRDVRDVASKTADNAVRLAAIFQYFEDGSLVIGVDAMEAACRIAAWHLDEARRFFGEIALPDELADLVRLDAWLIDYARRKGVTEFSSTEIMQNVSPTKFRTAAKLQPALSALEAESRLRMVVDGRRKIVKLNPRLLAKE